jgi:hypothetical protein
MAGRFCAQATTTHTHRGTETSTNKATTIDRDILPKIKMKKILVCVLKLFNIFITTGQHAAAAPFFYYHNGCIITNVADIFPRSSLRRIIILFTSLLSTRPYILLYKYRNSANYKISYLENKYYRDVPVSIAMATVRDTQNSGVCIYRAMQAHTSSLYTPAIIFHFFVFPSDGVVSFR